MDGLILAASLVLLHEARNDRNAPGLARFMLMRQSGRCATSTDAQLASPSRPWNTQA